MKTKSITHYKKQKPIKDQLKNNNYFSTVLKINNKYVYCSEDFILSKIHHLKKKQKRENKANKINKIRQISQKQIQQKQVQTNLDSQNREKVNLLQPILITKCQKPVFTMPQNLQVTIHEGQTIKYTDDALYYRISTQQFMQQILNKKDNKNGIQKQRLNFSVPQMQLKVGSYQVPQIVSKFLKKIHKVNLWIYTGKRNTQWHYDGHDNLLYVLQGKKVVYLAQPNAIKSRDTFSLFNNHCQKSDLSKVKLTKAIIKPHKCLFIPKGWWHKVLTYGHPSIALNYWGNSANDIIQNLFNVEKTLVFKTLFFDLANKYCLKVIPNWQKLQQQQKQSFRKLAGHKIMEQNNLSF